MKRPKNLWLWGLGWLVIFLSTLVLGFFDSPNNETGDWVDEVVDGDTFFLANRQAIRLFELDAPSIGYCYGQEAKEKLQSLIANKRVTLVEPQVDVYNRVMALVYVEGVFVNEEMIKNGFALYNVKGSSQKEILLAANNYAREKQLGIFSSACTQKENPDNPVCNIKGNFDPKTSKKIYHLPDCPNYPETLVQKYLGEQWFCTEKEAQAAGFAKAANCP